MGKEIGHKCMTNGSHPQKLHKVQETVTCRFSIFYCGCKQPKSIHTFVFECKVTKKKQK